MTEAHHSFQDGIRAAKTLSAIVLSELDVEVTHQALTLLLKSKWNRIAPLAHIIHGAADSTKFASGEAPLNDGGYVIAGYRYRYAPGSTVENPWRFTEQRPTGIEGIEVEPVYKRSYPEPTP